MPEAIDFADTSTHYMEMPSGKDFYIANPVFDWEDIAYTLAGQPRYNGTARRNAQGHTISVAEHCVRASYEILRSPSAVNAEFNGDHNLAALTGLMHDVTEAFLGDVPGPWKALLPDFVKLEAYLWEALCDQVGTEFNMQMPRVHNALLKLTDWDCLFLEAREIMTTQGRGWAKYDMHKPSIHSQGCHWWTPEEAEARWHMRLMELVR